MANFERAVTKVLDEEGIFSDHPSDTGGATRFGISQTFLDLINYPKTAFEITIEEAKDIYKKCYWIPIKGDEILIQNIAEFMFDSAVQHGVKKAVFIVQDSLATFGIRIKSDGAMGPKTLGFLNEIDEPSFLMVAKGKRFKFYDSIVSRNPEQKIFWKGWMRRLWRVGM